MRGRELSRFADAKRLLFPDRGLRIPNGWNAPDEHFRKGADKFWEATRALASL
jgi:RNA-directed DNA polymerase